MTDTLYEIIDDITVVYFRGNTDYAKVKSLIDELVNKDLYTKRIYDLTAADFDWSLKELQSMAAYGRSVMSKANAAAFVTNDDLAFGELRQFEAFREDDASSLKVFRDFETALVWIKDPI